MGRGLYIGLTLAYLIVSELMLAAALLYWPNFSQNISAFKIVAPLPMLRDMVGQLEEGGVVAYVVSQQFFKGFNTLGTLAAVLFGSMAVAGESYRGTLEVWLARPLSRWRILTERFLLYGLAVVGPVFLTSATIPWLLGFVDEQIAFGPLMLCALHQSLFLLALFALTFLISAMGRNPIIVACVPLFATTLMYSVYFVKIVTHYSLFRLVDTPVFMRTYNGGLDSSIVGWFIGATLLCFVLAHTAFRRRLPV